MGAGSIPAAPLPFQLPACGPGKQSRTAQSFGTLHLRAVALTWGVNQQMEDLSLLLSVNLICFSNKSKLKKKIWAYRLLSKVV